MSPQKANKPAPNKITGEHPGAAVKEGWETKRVREIAKHSLGKMLDKAKNRGDLRPYLRNLNVRWFDFDLTDVLEMRFLPEESEKYTAKKGDVLICEGGYPGRAAIWENDEPIYFQKALHRVRFYEPERAKWFLYYLLSKDLDGTLKSHFNGAGIQHFTGEALAQFEVPLPPLPEQKRIVALLDEAFAGIATAKANAEKNLQNARTVFESHLQSVFTQRGEGWDVKPLGELSQLKNGLNYNKRSGGQTLPVVGVADFQDNDFVPISELQSATIDGDLAENYAIQRNDILTVRSNGSKHLVGRCMLVGDVDELVSYSGFIIRIRFDAKIVFPEFLLHFMKCKATRDILTAGGGGANITNINQEKLSSLLVPLPPYKTQVQVASALDSMRAETQRLASIYEKKIAALDALKKALLRQAFSGEL